MKLKNLYLDIDGVILTQKNTKPSENSKELIEFIINNFNCFWLTTHCKGETETTINYLSNFFDKKTIQLLTKIQSTNWTTLKTEAIDFNSDFIWLDDYPFNAEKEILRLNFSQENLIEVNLLREKELLNVIEKLDKKIHRKAIIVEITKFIENSFPGWVECELIDAMSKKHIFHEKIPIVYEEYLDENSIYPQKGLIMCEILRTFFDDNKRKIINVTTEKPLYIETLDGINEFDILENQIVSVK